MKTLISIESNEAAALELAAKIIRREIIQGDLEDWREEQYLEAFQGLRSIAKATDMQRTSAIFLPDPKSNKQQES